MIAETRGKLGDVADKNAFLRLIKPCLRLLLIGVFFRTQRLIVQLGVGLIFR